MSGSAVGRAIQTAHNTEYDRHPYIFRRVADLVRAKCPGGARVLSFGCSRGEETLTLAEKYFDDPRDRILGVDIASPMIAAAVAANRVPDRVSYGLSNAGVLHRHGPFDAIFAMSVLCVWPQTKDMADISPLFSFAAFSAVVDDLDRNLQPGGILTIFNANYRFADTATAGRYRVLPSGIAGSGFVQKFRPDGRRAPELDGDGGVIFEKLR